MSFKIPLIVHMFLLTANLALAQGPPVDTDIFKSDTAVMMTIVDSNGTILDSFVEHLAIYKVRKKPALPISKARYVERKNPAQPIEEKEKTEVISAKPDTSVARLIFCGGVEHDLPVGVSNWFFRNEGNEHIYAFYSHKDKMNIKKVRAAFYFNNGSEFEKSGENLWFSVNPKWTYTFFKCYFSAPGDYKVMLYNEAGDKLAEGLVTILNR